MEPIMTDEQRHWDYQALPVSPALNERYLAAVRLRRDSANTLTDLTMEVWDIMDGSKVASQVAISKATRQQPPLYLQKMAWAPDNKKLALAWSVTDPANGKSVGTIEIWDFAGKVATLREENPPDRHVGEIVWAPDSQNIAFSIEDTTGSSTYEIWDALAGMRLHTIKPATLEPTAFEPTSIVWSPDGRFLMLETVVYAVGTGQPLISYPLEGNPGSVAWSPDGQRVALVNIVLNGTGFSSRSSTLFVRDALSGKQIAKYEGNGLFFTHNTNGNLIWSPDGQRIMVVGSNIDIWRGE
jgi:WD40 repeat protein